MWRRWSLRAKIVVVTIGVVLPVLAAATALTVGLSRAALEDDIRHSGLALARELAASAASGQGAERDAALQREISSLLGKGSVVRDAAVYWTGPHGLAVRVAGGRSPHSGPEDEVAVREGQEVVTPRNEAGHSVLRVAVPVRERGHSVGVVSLGLSLNRAENLAWRTKRQAIGMGIASVILIVGSLSAFMNRALTRPVQNLVQVMRRAEGGDLAVRMSADREDEVGQLAAGLNRMLEQVGSFQTELVRQVAEATAELRRVNQRLFAAQQQIGRNERLAAAGELAAALAHDVGTPLTAVSGHLQLLQEEVADPSVKERLGMIHGHLERVVVAARRFLDAARPEPARATVDVNVLVEDLLILIAPEVERKGITVTRDLAPRLPPITADPGQMQELFLNLITNAVEAMEGGGLLRLVTEATPGDDGAPEIRVTVEDTGPGMPPEVLGRAFEPFFTTRGPSGGTGLGLAICRRIATQHGGSIRLESTPGRGTQAIVELPGQAG